MSTLLVQSGTFDNIADAIRAKTGKVASMTPLEMPQEIASISGGGGDGLPILNGKADPTASQGTNGQLYFKYGENGVDLSTFTFRNTGGVTCASSKYALVYTYNSGTSIGAESRLQMDLTNVNELKFTLSKFHKTYDNNRTIKVYIENTLDPASNWISSSSLTPDAEISTNDTTNTYTVDVSSYTGNYWVVITSHGVSGEFRDLIVDGNVVEKYVMESKAKINDAWQDLILSDIDDITLMVGGVTILSGTSDPTSSQGYDGQEYIKYGNYIYKSFYDGTIIVRENTNDATDVKLFVNGYVRSNTDYIVISDSDLLAYLTDITSGKTKGCDCYNQNKTTQYAFIIMYNNGNVVMNFTNSNVTSRVTGTFYGGMVDLNQSPVTTATNYQRNGYQTCNPNIDKLITNVLLKVNGNWQNLIGGDIDDVNLGS